METNQNVLLLRLGFALRVCKGIRLRRRVHALYFVQQGFNRQQLDFRIILAVPELRFVTARVHGFVAHQFVGLRKQRETNSARANGGISHLHQTRDLVVFFRAQNGFKVGKNLVAIYRFKSP